jgi:hypothetical protein
MPNTGAGIKTIERKRADGVLQSQRASIMGPFARSHFSGCHKMIRLMLPVVILLSCSALSAGERAPVPIILDTDIASDVDDVGAVALLHALANRGEAKILAMGVAVDNPWSALCLDAINTYFHRPEIPIGVIKGHAVKDSSKYAQDIASHFPHDNDDIDDLLDAPTLYRQVLAKQPDGSAVIVSIGMLTNLRNLLESGPDEFSPLGGRDLVKQKVRAWVCMGGKFPSGHEYNLIADGPAAQYTVDNWPTPVVFSGHEIGNVIMTGPGLRKLDGTSPIRRAFELYNGLTPRSSYDQTAVLYAVRGLDGGLSDLWSVHTGGRLIVNKDGSDKWQPSGDGHDAYLVQKAPPSTMAKIIEDLMLEQPAPVKN